MTAKLRFAFLVGALPLTLAVLAGCKEEFANGPRVPTFPVTGQVLVDGKPAAALSVRCEPTFEKAPEVPSSAAFTTDDGKFAISTFESGDGAPAGKYKVVFFWGQFNLMSGQYGGPDKLRDRYRKPENSQWEITVGSEPIDLGKIELSTK